MFRSLVLLAALIVPGLVAAAEPTVAVRALAVGTGVADRTLEGAAERFSADVGRVTAHVTLANPGAPAPVTLVWSRDGVERLRVELTAGTSARWRTWAHKRIAPTEAGEWRVEVRDAAGAVLAGANFTVEAAARPGT